jgi:type IV secretion system protein VirB4
VVCELDLKGFDAELKVISGRASSVEELHQIMANTGPDPAHWLPVFTAS